MRPNNNSSRSRSCNVDSSPALSEIDSIKAGIVQTPHEIVVRSLRRRLWHAMVNAEDGARGLRIYQANRIDWEGWVLQEKLDAIQQRLKKEKDSSSSRRRSFVFGTGQKRNKQSTSPQPQQQQQQLQHSLSPRSITEQQDKSAFADDHDEKVGLLQLYMDPSDYFVLDDCLDPINDPYDDLVGTTTNAEQDYVDAAGGDPASNRSLKKKKKKQQQQPQLRQAINLWGLRRNSSGGTAAAAGAGATASSSPFDQQDPSESLLDFHTTNDDEVHNRTTPLHEAARLGYPPLLRGLLESDTANPNSRNGYGRTALHMVAGGVTDDEKHLLLQQQHQNDSNNKSTESSGTASSPPMSIEDIGIISRPEPLKPPTADDLNEQLEGLHTKAARAVGRLLFGGNGGPTRPKQPEEEGQQQEESCPQQQRFDQKRWNVLQRQRLETCQTLLSWSHADDGSELAGQGLSTNAVDALQGRTALHYAAALGRNGLCLALASSFGCLLTVLDKSGRTPCEWAAASGGQHDDLAATLEARALLYIDPYGMNDELLAAVDQGSNNVATTSASNALVPPFLWFETLCSFDQVQKERERRVNIVREKILRVIIIDSEEKAARALLEEGDSSESSSDDEDDGDNSNNDDGNDSNDSNHESGGRQSKEGSDSGNENDNNNSPNTVSANNSSDTEGDEAGDVQRSGTDAEADNVAVASASAASSDRENTEAEVTTASSEGSDIYYDADDGQDDDDDGDELDRKPSSSEECLAWKTQDLKVLFGGLNKSHIQLFLTYHRWDTQKALLAFIDGPIKSFQDAHIRIPVKVAPRTSAANPPSPKEQEGESESVEKEDKKKEQEPDVVCLICCDSFGPNSPQWKNLSGCKHSFCKDCLGDYIEDRATSKSWGLAITCPHHECGLPLSPLDIAELAPSSHAYDQLLETENKNFIINAGDIRFCPHPGCEGIVKFNTPTYIKSAGLDAVLLHNVGAVCTICDSNDETVNYLNEYTTIPQTYEGVPDPNYIDCRSSEPPRKAHRFCFACGEPGHHWPVTCSRLEEWKAAVEEQVREVREGSEDGDDAGDNTDKNYNDLAQKLWLKTNTRPCPKCKAPIEKNEGCNHMTCSNPHCKFEFCWICSEDWKKHSTETGGFYLCNRWVDQKDQHEFYDTPPADPTKAPRSVEDMDPHTMASTYGTAKHSARAMNRKSRAMARFLHHYRRWNAHADSAALERAMGDSSCTRLAPIVRAAVEFNGFDSFNFDGEGLSFVHNAFAELLECRSMLQHSYAFSFFRYKFSHGMTYRHAKRRMSEKAAFEQLQSELEMLTEQMSDVVARLHLRATQAQIKFLTAITAEKRKEFSNLMLSIHMTERKEQEEGGEGARTKKKRKKRHKKKIRGLPDDFTLTLSSENNQANPGAADAGGGDATAAAPTPPALALQNNGHDDEMEEAIRASLEDFMASTGGREALELEDGQDDGDWACGACTYMNHAGRRCEMCGTSR